MLTNIGKQKRPSSRLRRLTAAAAAAVAHSASAPTQRDTSSRPFVVRTISSMDLIRDERAAD